MGGKLENCNNLQPCCEGGTEPEGQNESAFDEEAPAVF